MFKWIVLNFWQNQKTFLRLIFKSVEKGSAKIEEPALKIFLGNTITPHLAWNLSLDINYNYLFLKVQSFLWALLLENCTLCRTDNFMPSGHNCLYKTLWLIIVSTRHERRQLVGKTWNNSALIWNVLKHSYKFLKINTWYIWKSSGLRAYRAWGEFFL